MTAHRESLQATLERLKTWPGLWRHPDLLILVHAASQPRSTAQLADALMLPDAEGVEDAWKRVLKRGDLPAVEAAHGLLSTVDTDDPRGLVTRKQDLERRREAFRRRVEIAQRRLARLGRRDHALDQYLRTALEHVVSDPMKSEQSLSEAVTRIEALETSILTELEVKVANLEITDRIRQRFEALVRDRNIRVCRWFVDRLSERRAGSRDAMIPEVDAWKFLQRPEDVVRWVLEPTLAPVDFRRNYNILIQPDTDEHLLLLELKRMLDDGGLDRAQATDIVRLLLRWLRRGERADLEIPMVVDQVGGGAFFAFRMSGRSIARMFPHTVAREEVSKEPFVIVAIPSKPGSWPSELSTVPDQTVVVWDLFDRWRSVRVPGILIIPFERIFQLRAHEDEHLFVRLVSRHEPVRNLVDNLCGAPWRLEYFSSRVEVQLDHPMADSAFEVFVEDLIAALDISIDDADFAVLVQAASNRAKLLLQVLSAAARGLPPDASSQQRRLRIARTMGNPDEERQLLRVIQDHIVVELGSSRGRISRELSALDYVFELGFEFDGTEGLPIVGASSHLFTEAAGELELHSEEQATDIVQWMLTNCLLRSFVSSDGSEVVGPNRTLVYTQLLSG
jgi:hypothetical protein